VVINVQSSHCYRDFDKFCSELVRVLQQGGHFYIADMRLMVDIPRMDQSLKGAGFVVKEREDITEVVLRSVTVNSKTREDLMKDLSGAIFVGVVGRSIAGFCQRRRFDAVQELIGDMKYMRYVLEKPNQT
jgi:hypothetical protein